MEEHLTGGFLTAGVVRVGGTVRRTAGSWSPAVQAVLDHLGSVGLQLAPRPVHLDLESGTGTLTFMAGHVPSGGAQPAYLFTDETLHSVARLVRAFHDATEGFTPPSHAAWNKAGACPEGGPVICHNDLAPWNTVFDHAGVPVAFIDWDLAAPGPRAWDIAFALWHFVPLYGDPESDPWDVTTFAPRADRARRFCDAYGLSDRDGLVDLILDRQHHTLATYRSGAHAGEPAYVRLWNAGAGDGIRRQINYVDHHRGQLTAALSTGRS